MTLKIVTPEGKESSVLCDSIHLTMADGKNGKGGGNVGIRKGHAAALIALAPGRTEALQNGNTVFSAELGAGFAVVRDDVITVILRNQDTQCQDRSTLR